MTAQHYFNSSGEWIAFRRSIDDRYLFDRHGNWVAWFPWNDNEAVDIRGEYLGTVVDGNRFYQRTRTKLNRPHPGYSVPPGHVGYAGHPGYAAYCAPPLGFADVVLKPSNARPRIVVREPRLTPRPAPRPWQIWMSRLGLGPMADRIGRMIQLQKDRKP